MRFSPPPASPFGEQNEQLLRDHLRKILNGGLDTDNIRDGSLSLSDLAAAPFSTYAPNWTSTGTAPALGNGTLTGRYQQVGKLVVCHIELTIGSTTTFGTGTYAFDLPVAPQAAQRNGCGICFDSSAGAFYGVFSHTNFAASTILVMTPAAPAVGLSPTVPFTWATGDVMQVDHIYEAA